ncbi:hypothetical protein SRABI118_02513 [Massilia sp. Bi118]|uniref:FecR family protein n=1 Tax=Massilia sp. Bi118 TaxID=2822346 RepID=UPI001DB4D51F|nr:FecR family protein [Massilia sp. Bi118]CAH0232808.1 hypothetical protein SRABI118_02513 [Massilia sp. Bi118]
MLKSLVCAALLLAGDSAWAAQVVGVVAHLSGPLLDRKADGSVKVLGPKSEIENGDTLVSEKNTYAQIRFVDNSEITLKPGTTFRVENFNYDAGKPEADSASFDLVKGGLRSITGLLGKRNKEKFSLKTPSATIGIRGTTFIAQYVPPPPPAPERDAMRINPNPSPLTEVGVGAGKLPAPTPDAAQQKAPVGAPALPPGLHVSVTEGAIVVTNNGGSLGFQAGQFGYVPGVNQAPVIVPPNTGLQFTPPPSFNGGASGPQASNSGSSPDKGGVDCIVR